MASTGPPLRDPTALGVQAGLARAAGYRDLQPGVQALRQRLTDRRGARPEGVAPITRGDEHFTSILNWSIEFRRRGQASERFTQLFTEMLTVAAIARRSYGDPVLTPREIESYLEQSYSLFNSFRHA
jgi:hypothetical protein